MKFGFVPRFFFLVSFFSLILSSCKKDGELSPDFDGSGFSFFFVDTLDIKTSVVREDSLRTDLLRSNLLGLYRDPVFGPVSSSIYTNVDLSGSSVDFGTTPTIDSVVLTLDYIGLYGDTSSLMSINVYELNSPLDSSTGYYSNTRSPYSLTLLGSLHNFQPNLVDSVLTGVDNVLHEPHIRVRLTDINFLTKLANGSPYNSDAEFNNVLRGLYITTVDSVTGTQIPPGTGSIAYLDMNSSLSTLTVYYGNAESDSLQESFEISEETTKYSRFDHNYSGTDIEKHLNASINRDSTVTYISSMAGVKTKLEFPTIKNLVEDGKIIINKAEIVFTLKESVELGFDENLLEMDLLRIDENGNPLAIVDLFEGTEHYGGVLDGNTYTFNISRHISDIINNKYPDHGMYIVARGGLIAANRSILSSEHDLNPNARIRLKITYSKF